MTMSLGEQVRAGRQVDTNGGEKGGNYTTGTVLSCALPTECTAPENRYLARQTSFVDYRL